ncbi:hypothetical protein D4R75_04085 [bacterium]|nr:MAG: hypothetical protein D4R75_04085 [bacterium]
MILEQHIPTKNHRKAFFHKGRVVSFMADEVLAKRIQMEAARLGREKSYVIRLILRKYLGLQDTGSL